MRGRFGRRRCVENENRRDPSLMPPGFSSSDLLLLLPELIVTGGAVLVLVVDMVLHGAPSNARHAFHRADHLLAWLTLGVLAVAIAALAPSVGVHTTVARGLIAVDSFAIFFKVLF